ncbi:DUF58 domain-containing protein [Massilia terrae]|uniref:DUF58 domain-containing protein n=1 Tax=Massilia terrae TaxID=1811224 RepID=A0ABT2CZ45_9BURK|nr:DUF58 domain-containing protein [Massilia terrae]MCS0659134.1 DUF58 domain-containing protein [Massilia terrae]
MTAALPSWVRKQAEAWAERALREDGAEVVLSQRRVYIVPTGAGIGFGGLLLVLLIGSINYNLGLGFALTFTAGACALVDMFFTWRNLAHLLLRPGRAHDVFAGDQAQFELHLVNQARRERYAIAVEFAGSAATPRMADVGAQGSTCVTLSVPAERRGWMRAPRVKLSTRFPLGLFRAWSYWQPDLAVLAYPTPEPVAPPLPMVGDGRGEGPSRSGDDDFAGVRGYQPGDQLRHLAWRQIARLDPELGGQLATKHFDGGSAEQLVIDFAAIAPQLDLELRLSRMTRWVLDAEQRALPYAFRLGAQHYDMGLGAAHQAQCLRALAVFGTAPR